MVYSRYSLKYITIGLLAFFIGILTDRIAGVHKGAPQTAVPVNHSAATNSSRAEQYKREVDQMNEDHLNLMASVSGIYQYDQYGTIHYLDIRSDGTGITYQRYSGGKMDQKNITWTLEMGSVVIGPDKYKIEGYDLIDSKQNRWTRESF